MTILIQQNNIWTTARNDVEKPDALTQIKHSAQIRKLKKLTGTKAGAASVLKDAASTAAGFIPVPIVGGIISSIINKVHSAVRKEHLKRKLEQVQAESGDPFKTMKYMFKTMDMDTFREHHKKVSDAVEAMEDGVRGHDAHIQYAVDHHAICPELIKRARQIQYALKHLDRFEREAADLADCATLMAEYSRQLKARAEQYRDEFSEKWAKSIPHTLDPERFGEYENNHYHANCLDNGYCVVQKTSGGTEKVLPESVKTGLKILFTSTATISTGKATLKHVTK